ncbi:hypothetical protein ACFL2G_01095 [Candidatus Omnitrophota bacterium]
MSVKKAISISVCIFLFASIQGKALASSHTHTKNSNSTLRPQLAFKAENDPRNRTLEQDLVELIAGFDLKDGFTKGANFVLLKYSHYAAISYKVTKNTVYLFFIYKDLSEQTILKLDKKYINKSQAYSEVKFIQTKEYAEVPGASRSIIMPRTFIVDGEFDESPTGKTINMILDPLELWKYLSSPNFVESINLSAENRIYLLVGNTYHSVDMATLKALEKLEVINIIYAGDKGEKIVGFVMSLQSTDVQDYVVDSIIEALKAENRYLATDDLGEDSIIQLKKIIKYTLNLDAGSEANLELGISDEIYSQTYYPSLNSWLILRGLGASLTKEAQIPETLSDL